jgi:SAM-dependent methyltransferase
VSATLAERFAHRACPACGAREPETVFEQRFAELSGAFLLDGYDVVACSGCGCGYADHLPSQDAFDEYYRNLSKYEYGDHDGVQPASDRARFADIAAFIAPFVPSPEARIVEIGCSTGGLLAALRELGFPNVLGVDPSPYCGTAAKRIHDLTVQVGSLSDPLDDCGPAGMVVLVGVLEHVRDLEVALAKIRKLLEAHGRIYVEVPDVTEFARFLDAPYQQFSIEHVSYFSPISLDNALRRAGFMPLRVAQIAKRWTARSTMPVIAAVYERSRGTTLSAAVDDETRRALLEYTERSRAIEQGVKRVIEDLAASQRPLIVWGVGTHTAHLLSSGGLDRANIRAFIDSNPKYQGQTMRGVPVLAPSALRERSEAVLISSAVYQQEITHQIRENLGCANEVILLYPTGAAH